MKSVNRNLSIAVAASLLASLVTVLTASSAAGQTQMTVLPDGDFSGWSAPFAATIGAGASASATFAATWAGVETSSWLTSSMTSPGRRPFSAAALSASTSVIRTP